MGFFVYTKMNILTVNGLGRAFKNGIRLIIFRIYNVREDIWMLKEYKWMNPSDLATKLRNALWDDYTFTTRPDKGHTAEVHVAQSDAELISPLAHNDKHFSSCFKDQYTADDIIQNALIYKASDIVKWIQKDRYSFENGKSYQEYAFSLDMGEGESIGRGFNDKLEELESPVVRVVLQRDFDLDTQFGFYVKTAYVDIICQEAELTGKSYTKQEILDMGDVKFRSAVEEAAFTFRDTFPELKINYIPETGQYPEQLQVKCVEQDKMTVAYITRESLKIKEKTFGQQTKSVKLQDIDFDIANKISLIQSNIKMRQQCQSYDENSNAKQPRSLDSKLKAAKKLRPSTNTKVYSKEDMMI